MDFFLKNISPPVAVAVSGGSDSLALALLAHKWAQENQGHIIALTVDHGLRSESAREAQIVKSWLTRRGIKHVTLKWEGEKPSTHLQERARDARYALLTSWCKAKGISTLLLGHHHHDQEETFWLRLCGGSGLDGLTAMKERSLRNGVTLIRPLLSHTKDELKALLKKEEQDWLEDPSNTSPAFFRSRFRAALEKEGLSSPRLDKTLQKLQEDFDFIQESLFVTLKRVVWLHEEGFIHLHKNAFLTLHPSLSKRLLSLCMRWFSSSCYPPRSATLQGILIKLKTSQPFTAGGIYWFSKGDKIYLTRELSQIAPPLPLKTLHHPTCWDERFILAPELKTCFPSEAFLAPLGKYPPSDRLPQHNLPPRLLPSLPAIWVQERIAAVPHLCYTSGEWKKDTKKFISTPPLFHDFLRFTI